MSWAVTILQANDVDVTGLQEFEAPQLRTFLTRTHGSWAVYPGLSAGESAVRNSIAWRTDTWQLVMGTTMPVPYFHGHDVPMPVVRLHNIASGQDVYFINVHNPASTGRWGNNEHWRDVATARELAMVSRIHATGYPVVLTGDFNERAEVFCRVVGTGVMRAAAGGTAAGGCAPPGGMGVDWIFGSAVIEFSGFTQQRTGLVQRATDHPFVVADATIPPLEQPGSDAGGTGVAGG
jgi:endonuclease/exonuclease/phosphatase family metal-dependent hydrolase